MMDKKTRDILITNFFAVILGLILSGFMILFLGKNPIQIFILLFSSMFRDGYTIGEIFVKATPLIFTALAFAFTFKASLFNIGAQGQFYIGSITAVSVSLMLPSPAAIPLAIILSFVTSGLWGGFIGLSKAKFKANEFLISMMSTYVALNLMNYLLRTVLMESKGEYPQTETLARSTWLFKIVPHTRLHFGFILALLSAITIWLILYRTTFGFRIRAVGQNKESARMSGVNPERIYIITFIISGGLAGLAGGHRGKRRAAHAAAGLQPLHRRSRYRDRDTGQRKPHRHHLRVDPLRGSPRGRGRSWVSYRVYRRVSST